MSTSGCAAWQKQPKLCKIRTNEFWVLPWTMDFPSHELLTRSFKDAFGMTPEDYHANPVRLNNFVKPQLLLNYALIDEDVPLITDGIVLEITRKDILKPQYFIGLVAEEPVDQMPGSGGTGVDTLGQLWDSFHENKSSL